VLPDLRCDSEMICDLLGANLVDLRQRRDSLELRPYAARPFAARRAGGRLGRQRPAPALRTHRHLYAGARPMPDWSPTSLSGLWTASGSDADGESRQCLSFHTHTPDVVLRPYPSI